MTAKIEMFWKKFSWNFIALASHCLPFADILIWRNPIFRTKEKKLLESLQAELTQIRIEIDKTGNMHFKVRRLYVTNIFTVVLCLFVCLIVCLCSYLLQNHWTNQKTLL